MKKIFPIFIIPLVLFIFNSYQVLSNNFFPVDKGYKTKSLSISSLSRGFNTERILINNNQFNNPYLHRTDFNFNEKSPLKVSGLGGGMFENSLLNGNYALFLGGGCAITLNDFFIGAYGLALSTSHIYDDFPECVGDRVKLSFNHGGLWFGWEYKIKPFLGFALSAKVGAGSVSYYNIDKPYFTGLDYTKNDVLVVTPQFETNIRLFPALKLSIGVGYRALAGLDPDIYNSSDFFSPVLNIGIFFGSFSESSDVPDVDE
jgi:hypothetical protein